MDHILHLASLGWPVFPCLANAKTPATRKGFKDASTDPDQIMRWAKQHPNCNWGLVPTSTAWVLDIDPLDDGSPNKAFTQDQLAEIADSAGAISISPGKLNPSTGAFTPGKHYWFRQPTPGKWISHNGMLPNVDTRSKTGYVVIPPSIRPHGVYTWAIELECTPEELPLPPGWLIDLVNGLESKRGGHVRQEQGTDEPAVVGSGEQYVSRYDFPTWVNTNPDGWKAVQDCIAATGGTIDHTSSDGTTFWRRPGKMDGVSATWNAPAGRHGVSGGAGKESLWFPRFYCFSPNWPPFATEDENGHRKGYSTWELIQLLMPAEEREAFLLELEREYHAARPPEQDDDDLLLLKIHQPAQPTPAEEPDTDLDPNALLEEIRQHIRPGGIMDLFAREVEKREFLRQPLFRYSAGLSLMSACIRQKVRTNDGQMAKVYLLNVAPTGEGKDCARNAVNQVILQAEAGADQSAVINLPHSGSALVTKVREKNARLILCDEIGAMLRAMTENQGNSNGRSLLTLLTSWYTTGYGLWHPQGVADARLSQSQTPIDSPFVSLIGFTVASELIEAITPESITSGFLPRVCLFLGEDQPEIATQAKRLDFTQWDHELVQQVRWWLDFQGKPSEGKLDVDFSEAARAAVWEFTPDALELMEEAAVDWIHIRRQHQQDGRPEGALFTRCMETAKRLAILFAADRLDKPSPINQITREDLRMGCLIVQHTAKQMVRLCDEHLASGSHGRAAKVLANWFKRQTPGKPITLTEITKGCRHKILEDIRIRDAVLNDMVKRGVIVLERKTVNGREFPRYFTT